MSSPLRPRLKFTVVALLLLTLALGLSPLMAQEAQEDQKAKQEKEKQAKITEEILVVGKSPKDVPLATGIEALYRKPNTSKKHPGHAVFPYRLRGLAIDRANHVWAMDISYIPMARGFVYLAAVMDWHSRRILSWRVSNSLTTDFCIEAVECAMARHGKPAIFNTDQGSQFTSGEFVQLLAGAGIVQSMDGKGCWRDNVFIERFWRSVKYEEVYLRAYESVSSAKAGIGRYIEFYNTRRPHSSLDRRSPDAVYFQSLSLPAAA